MSAVAFVKILHENWVFLAKNSIINENMGEPLGNMTS